MVSTHSNFTLTAVHTYASSERLNIVLDLIAAQVVCWALALARLRMLFQALCKERVLNECMIEDVGQIANGPL